MTLKNKIAATIIPVIAIGVILINLAFGFFFHGYVLAQEEMQVQQSETNIASFFNERMTKYTGIVNDWAHWDDTYQYIAGQNPRFAAVNIVPDTFRNLDLSFMVLVGTDGKAIHQQYYSIEGGELADFPTGFLANLERRLSQAVLREDTYGVYQIGNRYYFIASSTVTNSDYTSNPNGYLVIGRQLDMGILYQIEQITGTAIASIHQSTLPLDLRPSGFLPPTQVTMLDLTRNKRQDSILISLLLPNPSQDGSAVELNLMMRRDLYAEGIRQLLLFAVFNTIGMLAVSVGLFILFGKYLSKPIQMLIRDVTSIDTERDVLARIPEQGNNEFTYLRKTINGMLEQIELAQDEVVSGKEKLQATLLSVGDGVISVDINGRIQFLNPVAEALTGWKLDEAMNQPMGDVFHIINEYTRQPVESPVKVVFGTNDIVELTNHTLLVSRDGTERPIEDTAAPIRDNHGQTIGCVLVFRDFSERKERQRRIEYLSYHDQLSGLFNRRFFEEELKRLDVGRNLPLSFIYSDVNGLKTINDAFGHLVGDQLIREVSVAMKTECRADDIIARTGGDEFIILLPNTDSHSVERLADRIRERVEQIKFMEIGTSIAFGWSTKLLADQNSWDVLKSAENMMYQKKILNAASKRNAVIRSILHALMVKSPRENAHSRRVSRICEDIGKAYNLRTDEVRELRTAGELHDIGKIAIDDVILDKTSRLSDGELAQIRQHPETGYRLLNTSNEFYNISEYVLAHHERWDGTGYPRGLSGETIPWKARIIAIADSYDAMTSDRPYHKAMSMEEAIAELKRGSGTQFDPDIAKVYVEKVLGQSW